MARRKHKKTHSRRRRRVGAVGMSSALTKVGGLAAGAAGGAFLSSVIKKALGTTTTIPKQVPSAAVIAAGIFLPKFLKGPMGENIGAGMIAIGSAQLVSSFIALPGISGIGYRAVPKIQQTVGAPGFANKVINGTVDPRTVGALWDN